MEHESCITLTHSRCMDPTSRLKTPREEGAGFFQLTKAYRQDGSIRFDTISELRTRYPKELSKLTWSNVYQSPQLQIRAGILKSRDLYKRFKPVAANDKEALAFADAAFNGGESGVDGERIACNLSSNCNPKLWFDNTERFCMKSKVALYGHRSACDINRHHVRDVFNRYNKYEPYFK